LSRWSRLGVFCEPADRCGSWHREASPLFEREPYIARPLQPNLGAVGVDSLEGLTHCSAAGVADHGDSESTTRRWRLGFAIARFLEMEQARHAVPSAGNTGRIAAREFGWLCDRTDRVYAQGGWPSGRSSCSEKRLAVAQD